MIVEVIKTMKNVIHIYGAANLDENFEKVKLSM